MAVLSGLVGIASLALHWIACWFHESAANPHLLDNALIALASVAGVVWTGGLVALQLQERSSKQVLSMDYLQTVFMACSLSIFAVGAPLRFAIIVFGGYYTYQAVRNIHIAGKCAVRLRAGTPSGYSHMGNVIQNDRDVRALRWYGIGTLLLIVGYLGVYILPVQLSVCILGFLALYFGMQGILGVLADATTKREKRERQAKYDRVNSIVAQVEELITRYPDANEAPAVLLRLLDLRGQLQELDPPRE